MVSISKIKCTESNEEYCDKTNRIYKSSNQKNSNKNKEFKYNRSPHSKKVAKDTDSQINKALKKA
jgi:hypothetical protein